MEFTHAASEIANHLRTVYLPSKAFQAKSPGDGEIRADGIVRIMVGGNVAGLISNKGSSKIFVVG